MEHLTFDQLPRAVSQLHEQMGRIERLLLEHRPQQKAEEAILNIHLSVATLYTKVSCRELPFSKRGKRLYFHRGELEEWVRQGRRKTVSEIREEAVELVAGRKRK
ncbi:helix-turn-helix domain-containing protein [Pontibacter burrus]|uniref:Helix-turn-helix domain-containing protein n=1 Tax=Pontibacter burrus TaxID=2704466 RepID=A0A6B3LYL3_9BACT|nr:helix-turn-helix domain-containing protein [Pontibacter burrus]NEM99436.1 helix-turn-helix domain-containing protein [Pontibacter burrus]